MTIVLAILLALQSAATGPRPGEADDGGKLGACPIGIAGHVVFPPYSVKTPNITIKLDSFFAEQETTSRGYELFSFNAKMGMYDIVIELPGMDITRQTIVLGLSDCKTTVNVEVPLRISPAIKPSPIEEDVVGIDSLMRKTPGRVVSAFENALEKEPKTDPAQMAATLADILATQPDYYDANLQLGLEYRKDSRGEDAIRALTRALELNSGSMRARTALGQYSLEANDNQKAADLLADAVRLGSMSSEVYYMLGSAYYKLNRLDLAEAALNRALSLSPELAKVQLQLYNVYMRKGRREQALKAMETYLEKSPDAEDRARVQTIVDGLRKSLRP